MSEFGKWLSLQIEDRLLTRREFCDRAGVNRSLIFDWLAGRCRPRGVNIVRIARTLGIDRSIVEEKLGDPIAA